MEQAINPVGLPNVPVPPSPKKNKILKFILIGIGIIIILGFALYSLIKRSSETAGLLSSLTVHPVNTTQVISHTRSISGVSENADELLKIIGLKHKSISGDNQPDKGIVKTEDKRFWFFTVGPDDCVEFCSFQNYMIDTQKNTVSDLDVQDVMYNIIPIGGSVVTIQDEVSYDGKIEVNKMLIYDASKNLVIDELNPSDGTGNYELASDNYYVYSKEGILYSRDIQKHTSTAIGRFDEDLSDGFDHDQEEIFLSHTPFKISASGDTVYALLYINKEPANPPNLIPTKDDPLHLIAWNLKDSTSKDVTTQKFNFPFYFRLLGNNMIFIGGGRDNNGVLTYPSYVVDIGTGVAKKIYSGPTNLITIDDAKKQIIINGSDSKDTYWGLGQGDYDSITTFDFSGNFVSKTDPNHGNITYSITKEGIGAGAKIGDKVSIDYSGYKANGDVFVTTYPTQKNLLHSETPEVILGDHKSVPGEFGYESYATPLQYGLIGMKIGEKRHIVSPPEPPNSNGVEDVNRGLFDEVPVNETVTFDVTLNAINGKSTPAKEVPLKDNDPITVYPPPPKKVIEDLITAKLGQKIKVDGQDIILNDVIEDNRCIMYADSCTPPNTFKLKATLPWITSDHKKANTDLIFELGANNNGIGNSSVTLKEVKPEREAGKTIKKSDYIFTFSVTHY